MKQLLIERRARFTAINADDGHHLSVKLVRCVRGSLCADTNGYANDGGSEPLNELKLCVDLEVSERLPTIEGQEVRAVRE